MHIILMAMLCLFAFTPGTSLAQIDLVPATDYLVVSIDLPSASGVFGQTSLDDINDVGAIVGDFGLGSTGFLAQAPVAVTPLTCPGNRPGLAPKSINNAGEITGFCGRDGFFRDAQGRVTVLSVPGADLTEAIGINDASQVVGDFRDTQGRFRAFFWEAGLFIPFDVPFAGVTRAGASGINNVGQIVGLYFDDQPDNVFLDGHLHGFLLDRGGFTTLDVPGAVLTLPMDINDAGQIVGVWADQSLTLRSFLLENGVFREVVLPFPSVAATDIEGINQRGQLVGSYLVPAPTPLFRHGLLLTPLVGAGAPAVAAASAGVAGAAREDAAGLRVILDGCVDAAAPAGMVIPQKVASRALFCHAAAD